MAGKFLYLVKATPTGGGGYFSTVLVTNSHLVLLGSDEKFTAGGHHRVAWDTPHRAITEAVEILDKRGLKQGVDYFLL
jgi:hypothetical protein